MGGLGYYGPALCWAALRWDRKVKLKKIRIFSTSVKKLLMIALTGNFPIEIKMQETI